MLNKVKIGDEVWELNTDSLMFSDGTLNQFFEKVSGTIDYVGAGLAKANLWHSLLDHQAKKNLLRNSRSIRIQVNPIRQQSCLPKVSKKSAICVKGLLRPSM